MNDEFTVKYPKSDLKEFFIIYFVIAALWTAAAIALQRIAVVLFLFLYLILAAALMLTSSLVFYVNVSGNIISYRTRLGKCGSFSVSDIKDIICESQFGPRTGNKYYITVVTDNRELDFTLNMENFELIAAYLLEKTTSGEINENAVTPDDIEELKKYRDGLYKPKD